MDRGPKLAKWFGSMRSNILTPSLLHGDTLFRIWRVWLEIWGVIIAGGASCSASAALSRLRICDRLDPDNGPCKSVGPCMIVLIALSCH